jgi:hypothetical protein
MPYDPAEVINAKLKARKTNPEPIKDGRCTACGGRWDPARDYREIAHEKHCSWVESWHPGGDALG